MISEAAAIFDSSTPSNAATNEDEEETPPPAEKAKGLAAILERIPRRSISVPLTSHEQAKKEVTAYSELTVEDASIESLDRWKQNSDRFPLLSTRSSGGYIVDTHRVSARLYITKQCQHVNFWQTI